MRTNNIIFQVNLKKEIKYIIKYIINYIIYFGVILTPITGVGQPTLQSYQDTAALNNPEIKAIFKKYEAVMEKIPQVGSLPDPTFGFGYFISSVETRIGPQQAVFSVSQSMPWFGKLDAQKDVVESRAHAVLEQYRDARARLNYQVIETYNDLYTLNAAIKIMEDNIRLLTTFKELANVRLESGKGSMVDVLRLEIELAELNNKLSYLRDSRLPLLSRFENLINKELDHEITFPKVLETATIDLSREILKDSIKLANRSIRSLEHEIMSYDKDVLVARKTGSPSLTVGINYTLIGERDGYTGTDNGRDALLPSVGVKIPLYRKNYSALVKEKELVREAAILNKENKINEIGTKTDQAFRDYADAVSRVELYDELRGYAARALDILLEEYSSNKTSFEEILRMYRKLLNYQLELEQARADQNTIVAYISYLKGEI